MLLRRASEGQHAEQQKSKQTVAFPQPIHAAKLLFFFQLFLRSHIRTLRSIRQRANPLRFFAPLPSIRVPQWLSNCTAAGNPHANTHSTRSMRLHRRFAKAIPTKSLRLVTARYLSTAFASRTPKRNCSTRAAMASLLAAFPHLESLRNTADL